MGTVSFSDQFRRAVRESGHSSYFLWKETGVHFLTVERLANNFERLCDRSHCWISRVNLDRLAAYLGLTVIAGDKVAGKKGERFSDQFRSAIYAAGQSPYSLWKETGVRPAKWYGRDNLDRLAAHFGLSVATTRRAAKKPVGKKRIRQSKRESFCDQFRRAVRESGYSAYEIWSATGVPDTSVRRLLRGSRWVTGRNLHRLAEFLDLCVSKEGMREKRESFVESLRRSVRESGHTLSAIWKETGIHPGALSRVVRGKQGLPSQRYGNPTLLHPKDLDRLATFLQLTIASRAKRKRK
jgi:predicted transcriptional regulator